MLEPVGQLHFPSKVSSAFLSRQDRHLSEAVAKQEEQLAEQATQLPVALMASPVGHTHKPATTMALGSLQDVQVILAPWQVLQVGAHESQVPAAVSNFPSEHVQVLFNKLRLEFVHPRHLMALAGSRQELHRS